MPITSSPNDFNHVTEWTDSIIEMENQSSFIKNMGLFDADFTNQEAILFDRLENDVTLIPSTSRRGGAPSYGKDDKVSTYSLPLSYFNHQDSVRKQDIMGKRQAGTADQQESLANAVAGKVRNARNTMDQVHEYMSLQAIKGICKTPDGTVLADMYTEFGVTQKEVDFLLGTDSTDISAKIAEVKDHVVKNLKTGGIITGPLKILVDRSFFDKLKDHPKVSQAYLNASSNERYQADLSTYLTWGISDTFTFNGVQFLVYGHTFTLPDGTPEVAIEADSGYVVPEVRGGSIFKSFYGPSQSLDSEGGAEMFAYEYRDTRGRSIEMEFETAPLMMCTKPAALVKVTTSN